MINNQPELETLTKNRNLLKGIMIGAGILWLFVVAAAFYFYSKKGNMALFVPVFSLIVVFLPVYMRFKTLDGEIKSKRLD